MVLYKCPKFKFIKTIKTKKLDRIEGQVSFITKKKFIFIKTSLHVAYLLLFACEIRINLVLKRLLRVVFAELNTVARFDVIVIFSLHFPDWHSFLHLGSPRSLHL